MERLTLVDGQRIFDSILGGTITKVQMMMQPYAAVQHMEVTVEAKAAPTILLRVPVSAHALIEGIVINDGHPQEIPGQLSIDDAVVDDAHPQETPKNSAMEDGPDYTARVDSIDGAYGAATVEHAAGCTGSVRWFQCAGALRGHCQQCDALSTNGA